MLIHRLEIPINSLIDHAINKLNEGTPASVTSKFDFVLDDIKVNCVTGYLTLDIAQKPKQNKDVQA